MVTNPAAIGEQKLVQEQEAIAGFVFATDPECRHVRRAAIVPGRGTVLLALPNLELFKHLVDLLESEGPNRANKICLVDAKQLTAIQRVHVLRELKEIAGLARVVMIDPRRLTGDPSHDALAMTRHLHESLETLQVALSPAFRQVDTDEQFRQAVRSAQRCWKLLCQLSTAVGDGNVSPGHALAATLEALHVRLDSARDSLAGCPGVADFATAYSQVYRVLTTTDEHEWSFAYDVCIASSDPAERFLMRYSAKFGEPQTPISASDKEFYRKTGRAISAFSRARAKHEGRRSVVAPASPAKEIATLTALHPAASPAEEAAKDESWRGELIHVGHELYLSPETRSFRFKGGWFEFTGGNLGRYQLFGLLARKPRAIFSARDLAAAREDLGWKPWLISDKGLRSAATRLKECVGEKFPDVADAIEVRQERKSITVSFKWPPRNVQ